jgi:hypothetical protein
MVRHTGQDLIDKEIINVARRLSTPASGVSWKFEIARKRNVHFSGGAGLENLPGILKRLALQSVRSGTRI